MNDWLRNVAGRGGPRGAGVQGQPEPGDRPIPAISAPWFGRFMDPRADRCEIIRAELERRGLGPRVVELDGGRFVVVYAGAGAPDHDRRYRTKVLTAHHDRVAGTPGALDNSAACAQLVDYLSGKPDAFNTVAVFTDREELDGGGPTRQGSRVIGEAFPALGIRDPMVFALDVSGRGDAVVLSTAAQGLVARPPGGPPPAAGLVSLVEEIDSMSKAVVRVMAGRAPVYRATIPFGEDLGFICAGVPALTVTILPRREAERLAARPGLPAWASPEPPGAYTPATWNAVHGPGDTVELYTAEAFETVRRLLDRLSAWKVPSAVSPAR